MSTALQLFIKMNTNYFAIMYKKFIPMLSYLKYNPVKFFSPLELFNSTKQLSRFTLSIRISKTCFTDSIWFDIPLNLNHDPS
jgi:hypothetical protein